MATHTSPALLKQRVGTSRTYIRPLQRDLDLDPIEDKSDVVSVYQVMCIDFLRAVSKTRH